MNRYLLPLLCLITGIVIGPGCKRPGPPEVDARHVTESIDVRQYKVFYSLGGREVPSGKPVEMSEADIYSELLGGLEVDGDLFGVIDDQGTTLQVMYQGDTDSYWVEIPLPARRGSFGRLLSFDEVTDLFKALPSRFTETMIPGMEFQSWG